MGAVRYFLNEGIAILTITTSYLKRHRTTILVVLSVAAISGVSLAAIGVFRIPVKFDGREKRVNVNIKAPYGAIAVYSGAPAGYAALIESQSSDPDDNPSIHARYYYNAVGAVGMLKLTVGSDEGMLTQPKEYAEGWLASNDGFSLAGYSTIHTDAGSYSTRDVYDPSPGAYSKSSSDDISRVFLTRELPMTLSAELGFGESMLDLSGLQLQTAMIETSAAKSRIVNHYKNPIPMDHLTVNAGLGECIMDGLCNYNCTRLDFSGGIGYYELHFNGSLQRNLDAHVEVGCGKVVLSIAPDAGRVQVIYDDNIFSSYSFDGLNKRRDGYYTSVGFDQSNAPMITLRLSAGVGKVVVIYK